MNAVRINVLIAVVACCSTVVLAQPYLELKFMTNVNDSSDHIAIVSFVMDASDPMQRIIAGTEQIDTLGPAQDELVQESSHVEFSTIIVGTGSMLLSYGARTDVSNVSHVVDLLFQGAIAPDPDGSIPDDPAAYTNWTQSNGVIGTQSGSYPVSWADGMGFTEGGNDARYHLFVREVAEPKVEPTCAGDLNRDGNLNFLDVSRFLELYSMGCE